MTQAHTGQGLDELVKAVESHREFLVSSGRLEEKARESHRAILSEYLGLLTVEKVLASAEADGTLESAIQDLSRGNSDPLTCALELLERHLGKKPIASS